MKYYKFITNNKGRCNLNFIALFARHKVNIRLLFRFGTKVWHSITSNGVVKYIYNHGLYVSFIYIIYCCVIYHISVILSDVMYWIRTLPCDFHINIVLQKERKEQRTNKKGRMEQRLYVPRNTVNYYRNIH